MENKLKGLGIIGAVGAAGMAIEAAVIDNVNHQYELSDALGFGSIELAFLATALYVAGILAGGKAKQTVTR